MSEIKYFTEEGLKKLKEELHDLVTIERPEISRRIAEARDKGDLSENFEYHSAKEAQGMLELKISQMQEMVRYAKIIDESKLDGGKVLILSKVVIRNLSTQKNEEYIIVPENEANKQENKISVSSPIAKGLLGKSIGEIVEIKIPLGVKKYEIINISR